jgi:hypothetical protein
MEMELELAAFVPEEYVASIDQRQRGSLLGCDADGGQQWNGQTKVVLQGSPDTTSFVEAVVAEYEKRDPYTARLETTSDGVPSAHVLGPYGSGWLMTESVDKTSMEILSFSPCFRLPEGTSPHGQF